MVPRVWRIPKATGLANRRTKNQLLHSHLPEAGAGQRAPDPSLAVQRSTKIDKDLPSYSFTSRDICNVICLFEGVEDSISQLSAILNSIRLYTESLKLVVERSSKLAPVSTQRDFAWAQ